MLVQWLGFQAITDRARVQFLVGELRSQKPPREAEKENKWAFMKAESEGVSRTSAGGGTLVSPFSAFHTFSYGMLGLLFEKSKLRCRQTPDRWHSGGAESQVSGSEPRVCTGAQWCGPEVSSLLQLRVFSAQRVNET